MKNETNTTSSEPATTFNTWGRVGEEQMHRMSELFDQTTKMQAAAFEQGKQLLAYNMKLAGEFQSWATEASRKVASQFLGAK